MKQRRILNYFSNPNDSQLPERYLEQPERSIYLTRVIEKLFPNKNTLILELDCGTGRNLNYLYSNGYTNICGIEQSNIYVEALIKNFPHLEPRIMRGLIEKVLPKMFSTFDLIFTMAVLQHIPKSNIFPEITKRTDYLLTIENEKSTNWNIYKRNYKEVFEHYGMTQIRAWNFPPLSSDFIMRLFRMYENE